MESTSLNNALCLPVLFTRGVICFPHNEITIEVGRKKSLNAVTISRKDFDDFIIVVTQKNPDLEEPTINDVYQSGILARIKMITKVDANNMRIVIQSLQRVKIENYLDEEKTMMGNFKMLEDSFGEHNEEMALVRTLAQKLESMRNMVNIIPSGLQSRINKGVSSSELSDMVAQAIPLALDKKQILIETLSVNERIIKIISYLEEERQINDLENELNKKVRQNIDENQREYILREKLKIIKEELGDVTNRVDETEKIRKMIKENPYPQYIKDKLTEELLHFEMMPQSSAESSIIRNYIDWLIKTPWYEKTDDQNDIKVVEQVLNEDHYGLEKVKQRILEYLAVKHLTNSLKAPIICFSGPPGVGKTSLAKSIARALNRKFVKVSLGGVRDEAEIRGHRRTYLGSMPGRIIQGMKKVGVINPVFLLDEIDKTGTDYKGDPANALLEVLDPEQNKFFSDNYLEEVYDLSNVLFIATANYLENIPGPLRDRLEIIEISSYTEIEKLHIAKEHLIKQSIEDSGLSVKKVEFSDEAILHIIRYYTREAGVRELARNLASICRKIAIDNLKSGSKIKKKISIAAVKAHLGKEKYDYSKKEKENQIGVVTGLAFTQFGGDILSVEVNYFKGKGNLVITGNLGDVMKESASIALDYIKANADKYGIDSDLFENYTIHIHFPEGAVPKDGPSAGVTMTTAMISALSKRAVRFDLAMTGEVTLRGKVLAIGGLREKSIAAHRSGIKTIVIPKDNHKNLDDIPDIVKENLEIVFANNIDDVLEYALVK